MLRVVLVALLVLGLLAACGGTERADTVTETVAAPEPPPPPSRREVADDIFNWMHERATTERWMRTLLGVKVEGDTAIIGFDPFKNSRSGLADINTLSEAALCYAVLREGFPGIDRVRIYVKGYGSKECP